MTKTPECAWCGLMENIFRCRRQLRFLAPWMEGKLKVMDPLQVEITSHSFFGYQYYYLNVKTKTSGKIKKGES